MKRGICLVITGVLVLGGCVSSRVARKNVLAAYRKGFRVGRVVGRDDVLFKLKSPDCYVQKVDELMNFEKDNAAPAAPEGGKGK